jgi:hypothetical protein
MEVKVYELITLGFWNPRRLCGLCGASLFSFGELDKIKASLIMHLPKPFIKVYIFYSPHSRRHPSPFCAAAARIGTL